MNWFYRILLRFELPYGRLIRLLNGALVWVQRLRAIDRLEPRDSDIYIISYPKSGTTWMQMILFQLTTRGNLETIPHLQAYSPHLEESETLQGHSAPRRIIKTHLPRSYWPDKIQGKQIYIVRDGLDVAVSLYHHSKTYRGEERDFEPFLQDFLNGRVAYGSWFRHVAGWWKEKGNPDFLFLRFEDLKEDLEGVVRQLARFLEVSLQEERIPEILERCSFAYMKEHRNKLDIGSFRAFRWLRKRGNFFRRGASGDGKVVTGSPLEAYRRRFVRHLGETELEAYAHPAPGATPLSLPEGAQKAEVA